MSTLLRTTLCTFVSLTLLLACCPTSTAADASYVASPSHIPKLENRTALTIVPGDVGTFHFDFVNRYDKAMYNISLTIEIYAWATREEFAEISAVRNKPVFLGSGDTHYTIKIPELENRSTLPFDVKISTQPKTQTGTYFVRFNLTFWYENESWIMKSRGYFSNEEWNRATENETLPHGAINFTALNVTSILPDYSFGVKKPIPQWPLYLLIALAALFALLAYGFYMYETYGKYPKLEAGYRYIKGKITALRLLQKRK